MLGLETFRSLPTEVGALSVCTRDRGQRRDDEVNAALARPTCELSVPVVLGSVNK